MKMNTILKCALTVLLIVACFITLSADVSTFDIYTIKFNGEQYHLKVESIGSLKDGSFDYYDLEGNVFSNAQLHLDAFLDYDVEVSLYKHIRKVDLGNIMATDYSYYKESPLHILSEETIMHTSFLKGNCKLLEAKNGNAYGFMYSRELKPADSDWLKENPIEKVVSVSVELCDVSFFAIEGYLKKEDKEWIISEAKKLSERKNLSLLQKFADNLYARKIIMIGFCSC